MAMTRPSAIALMGPTASGKSALALEWAQRLHGEIVSVDSALVYRGLDIGAAKPTAEEQALVPHHLVDIRDPWEPYSAAEFAADARAAIDGIVGRGKLPILAGGTGLYYRALLHGLADMPGADPAVRAQLAVAQDRQAVARQLLHHVEKKMMVLLMRQAAAGDDQRAVGRQIEKGARLLLAQRRRGRTDAVINHRQPFPVWMGIGREGVANRV